MQTSIKKEQMLNSKDTHPLNHHKHLSNPKLKREVATMNMDPNHRGNLQKESPTTTTTKAPTSSPKQHQPPFFESPPPPQPQLNHHQHHYLITSHHHHHPFITTPTPTTATPQFSKHKSKTARLKPKTTLPNHLTKKLEATQTQIKRKMQPNNKTRAATPV
ncbi:hypothetical protein MtrunA17_Chr2g0279721 [Medicago truncatula]|uniref:Uncharacterized protein n=1 Tax=Medicago truncatula TaxID=3880 RepID=A0A072V480_MEDTR|nr:hypothetical protein MTR_2g009737 [Medicago truncatula]RHN71706.1 hypothetical protein MtrunA17_Chr2g0279721 [Medicago truncatula]